jgi:hypothetical protein
MDAACEGVCDFESITLHRDATKGDPLDLAELLAQSG